MNINYLRHMVVFSQIIDEGGVSQAAAKLQVSKSVVSQQLKALECELGVTLLNRNTRSQTLTTVGKSFYEHCLSLNILADKAWNEARNNQNIALGDIRISAPNALIEPIIAPAVAKLIEKYEGIRPTLLGDDKQVNLINQSIHLAIRVGKMPDSEYKQRKLGEFRDVLCAKQSYLQQNSINQASLLSQGGKSIKVNYIANSWQGDLITHHLTEKFTKEQVTLKFAANRTCNSLPAVLALVRAGCGLAYIPNFIFEQYRKTGDLIEVMPDYWGETSPLYAVHAYANEVPFIVNTTIDTIKQSITEVFKTL